MNKLKTIYNNDLSELQSLMYEIEAQIHRYRHVSEHLPKSVTNALNEFRGKVNTERERREDEEC